MQLDYGNDKMVGLAAMVDYARKQNGQGYERYLQKVRGMSFKQFVNSSESLENACNYGFAPIDAVRERISWTSLRKKYTVAELMNWGMTFNTAVKIGLKPSQIGGSKGFQVLQEMGATAEELKEFLYNFESIKSSSLGPMQLQKAGFSFADLLERGCSAKNMRQMEGFDIKSIVLAFQPSAEEWLQAQFTDNVINKAGWDGSLYRRFVASQTCNIVESSKNVEAVEASPKVRSMANARAVVPPKPEDMRNEDFSKVLEASKSLNFKLNINS